MATQSNIQSLLQGGLGLQSLAQANAPTGPNTGNPNTVYNLAAPNVRLFDPATGALPPMGDAFGNWAVPQVAAPVSAVDPRLLQVLGNIVQQTNVRPVVPTGPMPTIPPIVIQGLTPPPVPQVTAPPMSDPLPAQPVTNNGAGPIQGQFGGGNSGFGGSNGWIVAHGAGLGGTGGGSTGSTSNNWYNDLLQLADVVTEPLLPGNWWLSGSEKFDTSNLIAGLATKMGIPVNQIVSTLGQTPTQAGLSLLSQLTGLPVDAAAGLFNLGQGGKPMIQSIMESDSTNPIIKQVQDHFLDIMQNDFDNVGKDLAAKMTIDAQSIQEREIAKTLAASGLYVPDARAAELNRLINSKGGPNVQGALAQGFGINEMNRAYNAAGNAGNLISPSSAAAIRGGAAVISGDAAASFLQGMASAQARSQSISDALAAAAKNRV